MYSFLLGMLKWIYELVNSYPLAIVLFTFFWKLVLSPLTYISRRSMARVTALQPKLTALQDKYRNDPQKMQQKQMELYKEEGVNPMGGCLPMLLTLPVIFIMFGIVRTLANEQIVNMFLEIQAKGTYELQSFLWVRNLWQPDAFTALVFPAKNVIEAMRPADYSTVLTQTNLDALKAGYDTFMGPIVKEYEQLRNGWGILPALIALVSLAQSKLMAPKQNAAPVDPNKPNQTKGMMSMMNTVMPIMMAVICWTTATGFTIYYFAQTLYSILEQIVISCMLKDELYGRMQAFIKKHFKRGEVPKEGDAVE